MFVILIVTSCVTNKLVRKNNKINVPKEFIISCSNTTKEELKIIIQEDKKQWQNVKSPIIATYKGNDFGDYMHIIFEDKNGNIYDFGTGKNNYGDYQLFENSGQYDDNHDFLNKRFKVYWNWEISQFS